MLLLGLLSGDTSGAIGVVILFELLLMLLLLQVSEVFLLQLGWRNDVALSGVVELIQSTLKQYNRKNHNKCMFVILTSSRCLK